MKHEIFSTAILIRGDFNVCYYILTLVKEHFDLQLYIYEDAKIHAL